MNKPTTYTVTIGREQCDFSNRITLTNLIGEVLGIAGQDADNKGFGVGTINEENHSWVLSRFAVEVQRLPKAGDQIEIKTWISQSNRLLSTRNFIISDQQGTLGEVSTQWCMIDILSRKAVDLSALKDHQELILGVLDATIAPSGRIASPQAQMQYTHRVAYSDLDFNNHLNSLRSIDLMLDMLPLEVLSKPHPLRLEVQYQHECTHGEMLTITCQNSAENTLFEITKNDTSATKAKLTLL